MRLPGASVANSVKLHFANLFTSALIKMNIAVIVLLILAVACEVFAYWGMNTVAGRRAFDEMAGIIPFAAGVFGGLLAACAVLAWWYARRTRARRKNG
jgi:uncharacterized protein (DUF697 family)